MKKFIVISSLLLCMLIGCSNTKKINMSETAIKIMKTYDLNLASVRDDVFDTIYFLDKDRFRRDLGNIEEAYHEILKRLTGK